MTPRKDRDWRARIRGELARVGWKPMELGRRMGLPHPEHVTRWVRARNSAEPLWTTMASLADALGVSLDWIAGRIPAPSAEWTADDLAGALKSLSPSSAKVVRVLSMPGGAEFLDLAAEQFLRLRKPPER